MAHLRTPAGALAVPEEFHKALRVAAAQAGKTIKAFITETLAEKIGYELEKQEGPKR